MGKKFSNDFSSPYKSPQDKITFGGKNEVYYIPQVFLQDQTWHSSDSNDYACIFSEEVGHVLIHFLFTGKYQILETDEIKNPVVKTFAHLKIALGVFLATRCWILPALRLLAQTEIESLSKSIHVFELVRLADETLRDMKHDIKSEEWLQDFLAKSLNKALETSNTGLDNVSLIDKLQDKDLIKLLAKSLINSYHTRSSKTNEEGSQVRDTESPVTDSLTAMTLTPNASSSDEYEIVSETRSQ